MQQPNRPIIINRIARLLRVLQDVVQWYQLLRNDAQLYVFTLIEFTPLQLHSTESYETIDLYREKLLSKERFLSIRVARNIMLQVTSEDDDDDEGKLSITRRSQSGSCAQFVVAFFLVILVTNLRHRSSSRRPQKNYQEKYSGTRGMIRRRVNRFQFAVVGQAAADKAVFSVFDSGILPNERDQDFPTD